MEEKDGLFSHVSFRPATEEEIKDAEHSQTVFDRMRKEGKTILTENGWTYHLGSGTTTLYQGSDGCYSADNAPLKE